MKIKLEYEEKIKVNEKKKEGTGKLLEKKEERNQERRLVMNEKENLQKIRKERKEKINIEDERKLVESEEKLKRKLQSSEDSKYSSSSKKRERKLLAIKESPILERKFKQESKRKLNSPLKKITRPGLIPIERSSSIKKDKISRSIWEFWGIEKKKKDTERISLSNDTDPRENN